MAKNFDLKKIFMYILEKPDCGPHLNRAFGPPPLHKYGNILSSMLGNHF